MTAVREDDTVIYMYMCQKDNHKIQNKHKRLLLEFKLAQWKCSVGENKYTALYTCFVSVFLNKYYILKFLNIDIIKTSY